MNQQNAIREAFQKGIGLLNQGDYEASRDIFQNILEKIPDEPNFLSFLGFVEASMGKVKEGMSKTKRAVEIEPANPQFRSNYAFALVQADKKEKALKELWAAQDTEPEALPVIMNLGKLLFEMEKFEEGVPIFQKANEKNPNDPKVLNWLITGLVKTGKQEEAYKLASEKFSEAPEKEYLKNQVAKTARATGRWEEAEKLYRQLLQKRPENFIYMKGLLHSLIEQEKFEETIPLLNKIIQEEATANNFCMLGFMHCNLRQYDEALPYLEKALELDPENVEALLNRGNIHVVEGEMDDAKTLFEKVLKLEPLNVEAHLHLSKLSPLKEKTAVFDQLENLKNRKDLKEKDNILLGYALGKMYDNLELWDKAFESYRHGNEKALEAYEKRGSAFDQEETKKYFQALKNVYNKPLLEKLDSFGNSSKVPVFIVGMPRSGTTLLEQIIASHSRVHGAGELTHFPDIAKKFEDRVKEKGHHKIAEILEKNITVWAESYLKKLPEKEKGEDFVTDKLPHNFLNIGLIKILFPKAKIIHIHRNPLDVCVSMFAGLFNSQFPYACRLDTLGIYYRHYVDLMAHWRTEFPEGFLEVQYENLVTQQEKTAKKAINYLGLKWEPQCLEFYKSRRQVKTMSATQVRKPVYTGSIDKWRRYEKHLKPLAKALGPAIMKNLDLRNSSLSLKDV